MSKRVVAGSALLAMTLAACSSGGHSGTSMPLAGPAAVSGAGSASTSSTSTTATGGGSQSTGTLPTGFAFVHGSAGEMFAGGALTYTSYGMWNIPGANPVSGAVAAVTQTPAAAMPKTGTASYAGGAVGMATTGTTSTSLTGAFNATADFSHMTVVGGMTMNQTAADGTQTLYDSYAFNAGFAAATAQFSGTITAANNKALRGTTSGALSGPQGQDIGGTFALQGGGTSVSGAFGGSATGTQPTTFSGLSTVAVDFSTRSSSGLPGLAIGGAAGNQTGTIALQPGVSGGAFTGQIAFSPGTGTFSGPSSSTSTGAASGAVGGSLVGPNSNTTSGTFGVAGGGTTVAGAFGAPKH
jgi:hypothetical protein